MYLLDPISCFILKLDQLILWQLPLAKQGVEKMVSLDEGFDVMEAGWGFNALAPLFEFLFSSFTCIFNLCLLFSFIEVYITDEKRFLEIIFRLRKADDISLIFCFL